MKAASRPRRDTPIPIWRHVTGGICIVILCGAWTASARATELCALPEVLRALGAELRRHGIYGTPDARSVAEVTEPEAAGAACSVSLTLHGANTPKYGDHPTIWFEVHRYHVSHLRNGLIVKLDQ